MFALPTHSLLLNLLPEEGLGFSPDRVFAVRAVAPRRRAATPVHHVHCREPSSVVDYVYSPNHTLTPTTTRKQGLRSTQSVLLQPLREAGLTHITKLIFVLL